MTVKYIVNSLEGLSEELKKEYREKDGRFYLDLDDSDDERIKGLTKVKNEAIADREELKKKVRDLESKTDNSKDQKRIQELEDQLKNAKKDGKYSEDSVNQIKADLEKEYKAKSEASEKKFQELQAKIKNGKRESDIKDALVQQGVRKAAIPMMTAFLRDRLDVVEAETGEMVTRVRKSEGEGFEVSTRDGAVFKSPSELIEELKGQEDYGFAFEGSKANGGGQADKSNAQYHNGKQVKSKADFKSTKERLDYLKQLREEHGDQKAQELFLGLPEEPPEE